MKQVQNKSKINPGGAGTYFCSMLNLFCKLFGPFRPIFRGPPGGPRGPLLLLHIFPQPYDRRPPAGTQPTEKFLSKTDFGVPNGLLPPGNP